MFDFRPYYSDMENAYLQQQQPAARNPLTDPYLKGDPQRYYFLSMPGNLSPAQKAFYDSNYNWVQSEIQKQIDAEAKQTGQLPTQDSFNQKLGQWDWAGMYAKANPMQGQQRYNFMSPSLRWY
jgi:hypothetical protein